MTDEQVYCWCVIGRFGRYNPGWQIGVFSAVRWRTAKDAAAEFRERIRRWIVSVGSGPAMDRLRGTPVHVAEVERQMQRLEVQVVLPLYDAGYHDPVQRGGLEWDDSQ